MRNACEVSYAFCDLRGDYVALRDVIGDGAVGGRGVYRIAAMGRDSVPGAATRGVASRGAGLWLSGDIDGWFRVRY